MIIAVDIDGVLCPDLHNDYDKSEPYKDAIETINRAYDLGHIIVIYTARGEGSGEWEKYKPFTIEQLKKWGLKYHRIEKKIFFDIIIEDKSLQSIDSLKKMFDKFGGERIESNR